MKKLAVLVAASLAAITLVVATATPVRADEARPSPVAAKVDKVFARLDADRDGRISRPEAEKGKRDFQKLLTFPPEKAAELIVDGVQKRRARVLIGLSAKVPDVLARLFPANSMAVFGKLVGASGRRAPQRVAR